ncbi:MAG: STAS domain-containing protein [Negativicutes bacterium]|nr:STAS domain-containing protein [Negativicutes bacterium]
MERNITVDGNSVTVKLVGKMHNEDAVALGQELQRYLDQEYAAYIFDMSALEYIDSSGLGVLITVKKRSQRWGGMISLHGLSGTIKELFEVTRLTTLFQVRA